jgi:pimeloyl-ACP methyl ester carboxylesterase
MSTPSEPPVVDDGGAGAVAVPEGARRPDRRRIVTSSGVAISVAEWGSTDDPPILFAHGGFDFVETLNVFAPMLADAGYRVVGWDQRGHGLSDRTALYSWDADTRDGAAVLATLGDRPLPIVGHSKGGTLALHLADALPHRISHLVNLDGLPSTRNAPDVADHERSKLMAREISVWLAHRRTLTDKSRKPGTIDELATRRGRMNPRLSIEWLRYLVTVGGRHDPDGWRWRIDPILRLGGFGPWRPEWSMRRVAALGMPFLGVLGLEVEVMGWGTRPSDVQRYLPPGGRFEALDGVGHFVHIEQPRRIADLVLELLAGGSR